MKPLRELYGRTPAVEFGPKKLKAFPQHLVNKDLNRSIVKRMVKWAVSEELLPVAVYQALATVTGSRAGKGGARETAPVSQEPARGCVPVRPT